MLYPFKSTTDIVEELRLRRWARENFCSEDSRDDGWHEIVLDEMRRRDQELLEDSKAGQVRSPHSRFGEITLHQDPVELIPASRISLRLPVVQ